MQAFSIASQIAISTIYSTLGRTFKLDILPTINIVIVKDKTAIISKTVIPVFFEKNGLVKKQKHSNTI